MLPPWRSFWTTLALPFQKQHKFQLRSGVEPRVYSPAVREALYRLTERGERVMKSPLITAQQLAKREYPEGDVRKQPEVQASFDRGQPFVSVYQRVGARNPTEW